MVSLHPQIFQSFSPNGRESTQPLLTFKKVTQQTFQGSLTYALSPLLLLNPAACSNTKYLPAPAPPYNVSNFLLRHPSLARGERKNQASMSDAESAAQGQAFPGARKLPLSPSDQLGNRAAQTKYQGGYWSQDVSGLCCHSLGLRRPQMRDLYLFTGQYSVLGQMPKKGLCRTSLRGTFNSLWESHTGCEQLSLFLFFIIF